MLRHEPALGRSEVVRVRRLRLWRLALVVITSATVAGFAIFTRGGRASAVRVVPNELVALDPRTGTPVAAVTVPGGPDRLVASGRLLWVTRRDGGTIVAVDPRQRTLAALADTGLAHVDAITAASGGAWAIGQDHLVRVDASLGIFVRRTMPRESTRDDNAFGSVGTAATASGRVWLATSHGIVIIDAGTGRTLRRIMSGFDATAIAAAAGRVWAVSGSQARVAELDDRTGRTLLDLRLTGVLGVRAPYPYAIAASGRVAWVLNGNTATLSMIDGDLGEVMSTTSIGVGSNPVGLAADARAAWVATSSEGAIIRVDAHTGVTRTFHVGFSPRGVALGDGAVWVAVQAG